TLALTFTTDGWLRKTNAPLYTPRESRCNVRGSIPGSLSIDAEIADGSEATPRSKMRAVTLTVSPYRATNGGSTRTTTSTLCVRPREAVEAIRPPTRPCRVRREVQSAEDAVDEKARLLEELFQFRERVRADRGAVLPCPLPIDHDLSGLVAASQDVERVLVEDHAPVVPDLPGLGRQGRRQGFAIEPLHEELPPRLEGSGHASEHRAVVLGVLEVSEGREEVDHRV